MCAQPTLHLWSFLFIATSMFGLHACSDDTAGGDDAGAPGTADSGEVPTEGPQQLRFNWQGARAVAAGNLTVDAPTALTIEQPTIFRIEESGAVIPALELPEGYDLPPVQFVALSEFSDFAYVSFQWPIRAPAGDAEGDVGSQGESMGSLFRVDAAGSLASIIDLEGRVLAPRPGADGTTSRSFEHKTPYHFDTEGNFYVIWQPTTPDDMQPSQLLVRYRPDDGTTDMVAPPGANQVTRVWASTMSADRSTLVVRGEHTYLDQITDQGIPRRQLFIHRYRLPDLETPIEILTPLDDLASVHGMQVSHSGDAIFFHGHRLDALSGIGRADVTADDRVQRTLLYGLQSSHAPVNHATTHEGDYTAGFFEYSRTDEMSPYVLHWANRWFADGDRASGALDHDAIMGAVAHLFATPVDFAHAGRSGPEALQTFLANEPYTWEEIQGFPAPQAFTSIFDTFYGWHFLEQHFTIASTGAPAITTANFFDRHQLAERHLEDYLLHVREIFFDVDGALYALVQSDWDDATQRFRRMQPMRILDASGQRALGVLPALATEDFVAEVYRMGRNGRHVFVMGRYASEGSPDGVHRIHRFDPSLGDAVVLEDMMVNVDGDRTISDFAVGTDRLYFAAVQASEPAGGFIDLETLAFTPFEGDGMLETIEAL